MRLINKLSRRIPGAGLTCLIVFLLFGCQKEEVGEVLVDADLQYYFDRFEAEGKARGIIIDFNTIPVTGILSSTLAPEISGQCQHDSNAPDRLVINQTSWLRFDVMEREFLVFHELGHCYLKRPHLDEKDSRGVCMSIMHSGASACRNDYNAQNRSVYLDELFNPN